MPLSVADIPQDLYDDLAWPFDFDMRGIPTDPLWFTVKPETTLIPLAGEGTGGLFAIVQDTGEILFVDSEGSGSIIAPSLEELLLIFVCHPYWRDLLKFSGGGSLREMRRVLPFAEADYYHDEPDARPAGDKIRASLGLPETGDMVDILHQSISNSDQRFEIFAPDGWKLDSLFNKFTVSDHREWKIAEQAVPPNGP